MPIQPCQDQGKPGFKWGATGKCYTGPNALKNAIKQMQAIKAQQGGTK